MIAPEIIISVSFHESDEIVFFSATGWSACC